MKSYRINVTDVTFIQPGAENWNSRELRLCMSAQPNHGLIKVSESEQSELQPLPFYEICQKWRISIKR